MTCRSGCPTQDHSSWGECARSVRIGLWFSDEVKRENAWNAELSEYRAARSQGIQPASTKTRDIRRAVAASNALDRPVDASKDIIV